MSFLALKRFNGKTEKGITFLYLKSASQPSVKMMLDNPNQGAQDHSSLADRIYSAEALWRQKWPEGSHTDCRSWFSQWRASLSPDRTPCAFSRRCRHCFWILYLSIWNWREFSLSKVLFKFRTDSSDESSWNSNAALFGIPQLLLHLSFWLEYWLKTARHGPAFSKTL